MHKVPEIFASMVLDNNNMKNRLPEDIYRSYIETVEGYSVFKRTACDIFSPGTGSLSDIRNHRRIIFNGNGYSEQWVEEAKKRGLENIRSSADAFRKRSKLCDECTLHSRR